MRAARIAALSFAALLLPLACKSNTGAYDAFNQADCLRSVVLTDQNGREVNLASLKGKPVLVDFIYTTCPGECLMLTQKMARVASRTPGDLTMVSITVDPEHDGPAQLAAYAKEQGVDDPRWLLLTGMPATIDRVLNDFQLRRKRAADGTVEHIGGVFMLGPDGHEVREYDGKVVKAATMVDDLQHLLAHQGGSTAPAGQ